MPLTTPGNSYTVAIDKQTDEATVSATADYGFPTYEGASLGPVYEERRIAVTDAASIQGDISKGPTYWEASFEAPMFAESLGRLLQSLWPTDTITGAGPYVHTYSGLGGVDGNGTPHDPLVFGDGPKDIPDDEQELAQTIAHALAAGQIEVAKATRSRKD